MENIKLVIKGFIIGVANIIPGVSGGTLAITLGIYEKLINIISHFFKNIKENIKFLLPIIIGAVLSILILSNVISYSLDKFPLQTTLFFIGLILGGIPMLCEKIKKGSKKSRFSNILIFLITFSIVTVFGFIGTGNNVVNLSNPGFIGYILLFVVGVIAAATMIIPGISGSFMLMMLGYYEPIINTIKDLTHFSNIFHNILILIPFGIGIIIGIVLIAKLIEMLLNKYPIKTYYGIIGFVLASIISILLPLTKSSYNVLTVIVGIIMLFIGGVIAYKLGDK